MISRIIVFLVILSLISPEIIDDATYILMIQRHFIGDFLGYIINTNWLVVWNIFYFSIYWESVAILAQAALFLLSFGLCHGSGHHGSHVCRSSRYAAEA